MIVPGHYWMAKSPDSGTRIYEIIHSLFRDFAHFLRQKLP